jgi:hypothetical protein
VQRTSPGVIERIIGVCLTLLAAAVAIYIAVRLIESIASTLIIMVAAGGALAVLSWLWRRHQGSRW